jgi:multidrug efflux pump subunit AcrB
MRRFNLSAWAVAHPALMLFLIAMITGAGLLSYRGLGRAEDPSFTIKVVVVTAVWPGASAADMQTQVADPIEKKLQELPYIDKVTTYTKASFAAMQVAFKDSTPAREVPQLFYQLRKKLFDLKDDLPSGLIGPTVNDEYGDVDSILYTLTADGADYAQLKKVAEAIRQRLLRVKGVTKVNLYGAQEEKIFVEFSHVKLATLGITPDRIFQSLARQNAVVPAGVVESAAQRVPLRVTGALDGAKMVAEAPVAANGRIFRLGDIATVTHGFADPPNFLVRQKARPAIAIGIVMEKGANILDLGPAVSSVIAAFMSGVPQGFDLEQIADQPMVVQHAVGEFVSSFIEALAIVLLVSFVALGWRTGIVVALSVPLVLAIVFIVMSAMGLDLHRITLGALIIALGLLVDDAIIAVEMMVVKMEQGFDRIRAASFTWESTAFPMLTGTLVTAAGFLPIGFASSSVGEYAGGIFWVVAIALLASWLVAVVFTPYIGVKLLPDVKRPRPGDDLHAIYDTRLYRALRRLVECCVERRVTVVLITVAILVLSIVAFSRVQQQFFPLSERAELFFQLRLPAGTTIGATLESVKKAEALLKDDQDISTYTAYVGRGSPRFWLGLNPQLPDEAFAEIVIVSKNVDARERVKARLEWAVAEGVLSEARVRVDRFNFGPPVGFPVQFRVIGPDAKKVRDIAYRVREVTRSSPSVVDPHLDWNEQAPYVRLIVDQDRVRALGMAPQDISQSLGLLISGAPITTVRSGIEKIEVIARATPGERLDLAHIGELSLYSRDRRTYSA